MDSVKQHAKEFLHGSGKHTAELKSTQAAPVTHETVQAHETHNTTKAIDREVHETHHQTTVQPVHDREVRSTEHHHNVLPVQSHHEHHGRDDHIKEKLSQKAGEFRDTREQAPTQQVQGENATLAGEHHHHHIHNTVQPVVDKQTIQPHVVHTTVPVHERVDVEPIVHKTDVAQPMSMEEFKHGAGVGGHGQTHETLNYTGNPLSIGKDAKVGFGSAAGGGTGLTGGHHDHHASHTGTGVGGVGGTHGTHDTSRTGGVGGVGNTYDSSRTGTSGSGPVHNSSLLNKLDPRVDSDGDGKKGVELGSNKNSGNYGTSGTTGQQGGVQSMVTGAGHNTGSNIGRDTTGRSDNLTGTHGQGTQGTGNLGNVTGTERQHVGHQDQPLGGSRTMPGGFDSTNTSTTGTGIGHSGVGNTGVGHTGTGAGTHGGFIDGRSPNDSATGRTTDRTTDDKEGGGIISGLMNKLKS